MKKENYHEHLSDKSFMSYSQSNSKFSLLILAKFDRKSSWTPSGLSTILIFPANINQLNIPIVSGDEQLLSLVFTVN